MKPNETTFGVIGLGYVGLPLAVAAAEAGYNVLGFDVDQDIVDGVNKSWSHVRDVPDALLRTHVESGRIRATDYFDELNRCDVISICVPTPLAKTGDPDLSYVVTAAEDVAEYLKPGALVILESTT